MKKTIRTVLAGLLVVPAFALGVSALVPDASTTVHAQIESGLSDANPGGNIPQTIDGDDGVIKTVIEVMLWIIGILSVIMLIYGGIRYTISGGDSNAVTAAKNTILYAIVGLVVAIFAYALVQWVFNAATGSA